MKRKINGIVKRITQICRYHETCQLGNFDLETLFQENSQLIAGENR